jgi:hypothetical protein
MRPLLLTLVASLSSLTLPLLADTPPPTDPAVTQVPVVFANGHDTDPRDRRRPIVLIANALKVTPEVFRQAFSGVHPAQRDGGPTDTEARANKRVLMDALSPYGVTDDRLNQVSNYYRYRRDKGEMWPIVAATGYATVKDGAVTGFVVTNPGSGYSSPPEISVQGMPNVHATATLGFDTDFTKNGAVKELTLAP